MTKRNAHKGQTGLTLVEVLVAVFILAIVILPLMNMFASNTNLLTLSYQKTDATYDAKAMMENLYPLGYADLFASAKETPTLHAASGKYYTLALSPGGPGGIISDVSDYCYMHLIINGSGSGVVAGPDGKLASGSLPAVTAADIAGLRLTATTAGTTYSLTNASGAVLASGVKPAGATAVLIVSCRRDAEVIGVTVESGSAAAVLVYAPTTFPTDHLTITNALAKNLYKNDAPPAKLLVTALLKTYTTSATATQESVFQDTFTVGTLP